ncbi:MAG: orotidine-5'-phosphate decarboxylase [Alistipes sp.]|jgi:orotidine-5'-phosphate decarboxylase|nr:orotidine-5'-phosphate decarboxylase [Alistipes sp.]
MTRAELFEQIKAKKSFLCVGLDTDYYKIPQFLRDKYNKKAIKKRLVNTSETIFRFNKGIIDATESHTIAYKPNLAFYEAAGEFGMTALRDTCRYIRSKYPNLLVIADAKRGDIGNTSEMYANALIGRRSMIFDAVTLAPYMGRDTVTPFLKYADKWAVVLALTSNKSADDFETLELADGKGPLWKEVLRKAATWGGEKTLDNTMFVVGATRAETLREVREIVPDHFLLVPGVGAQGGSLEEVAANGMNSSCGLLVNSSRGIIYAGAADAGSNEPDSRWNTDPNYFATAAAEEARKMAAEMASLLEKYL